MNGNQLNMEFPGRRKLCRVKVIALKAIVEGAGTPPE
jgi:hypothetical protein